MTALLDLRNNRNAQTGQKVLIDYTSGGVGIFAVQAGAYSLENGHTNFIEFSPKRSPTRISQKIYCAKPR